jgi:23S rRNA (adenine2503-C2)-methyltransferase
MNRDKESGLLGLNLAELTALVVDSGQPSYRAQQLFEGIYRQRVASLEQVSNLPRGFRQQLLDQGLDVGLPVVGRKFVSQDGTVRYLIRMADGQTVETVWMPEGDNGESGDGSALRCVFPARLAARWIVSSA